MKTFRFIFLPLCVTIKRRYTPYSKTCSVTVMGPDTLQGCHWMLLVADTANHTVSVLNSLPDADSYTTAANRYMILFK